MVIYLPKTPKISTESQQILLITYCLRLLGNFLEILFKIFEHFAPNLSEFAQNLSRNF